MRTPPQALTSFPHPIPLHPPPSQSLKKSSPPCPRVFPKVYFHSPQYYGVYAHGNHFFISALWCTSMCCDQNIGHCLHSTPNKCQTTENPEDIVRQKASRRPTWRKGRLEVLCRTISLCLTWFSSAVSDEARPLSRTRLRERCKG